MDKKKIIHIVPTFELGGVQTGILYSLEELNEVYDYRVLVLSWVDDGWLKNLSPQLQDCIIQTGASNVVTGWVKAYKILKKRNPDFIISSLWKSVMLSVTYKSLNPKVYLLAFFHNAFAHHILGNFFLKIISLFQDSALSDSSETKIFVKKKYNIKNISVIPYNFKFAENNFKRKEFNPTAIKMVYFGRLLQMKGVDRGIEFCRLCKAAGINFSFELYGGGLEEGYSKNNYPEIIKKLGLENEVSIKKIISPSIVLEKMYQYDFLLQLSNREGMALSVVEAMNCGLVPIVTPVGEISKYTKDGVNAIWLDPEFDTNLHLLVNKLNNVLKHPGLYKNLSSSAASTFTNYKKYSEALIETIDAIIINESNVKNV